MTQLNALYTPNQELLMKLGLKYQDTYCETFYTIYMWNFSQKCHTEKPVAQMYISPSQFSIVTDFWMVLWE
jgi:hypothetical protein